MNNTAQDIPQELASDLSNFMKEKPSFKLPTSEFKKYLVLVLGGFILIMSALVCYQMINSPLLISFTGVGTESAKATKAAISFIVASNNTDVTVAVKTAREKADAFKQLLLNNKVESKDISSSEVSVTPAAGTDAAVTYQAAVSISFTTENLTALDDYVSLLYSNGSVYVSQPVLTYADESNVEQKALNKAIVDAKTKADAFANKNFKLIKKIVAIDQQTAGTTSSSTTNSQQAGSTNGTFNVAKGVTVTYKMW